MKPNNPKHWPLQIKTILAVVISQILLSSSLFYMVLNRSDEAAVTSITSIHQQMDTMLATTLVDPLLQKKYMQMQQILNELVEKGAIYGIKVTGTSGYRFAEAGNFSDLQGLTDSDPLQSTDWSATKFIRKVSDLRYAGHFLGTVYYSISLEEQHAARQKFITQFIAIAAALGLITVFLAYLYTARIISRLRSIRRVGDAASRGDFSVRARVAAQDEIGKVALGVNKMAESVQERIQDLIQSEVLKTSYLYNSLAEKARLQSLLNSMRFGIVFLNESEEIVYFNDAFKRIWPDAFPNFLGKASNHGRERTLADGRIVFETSHIVMNEEEEGMSMGSLWVFEDITEEKAAQKKIQFLAERDSLTGLFNRRSFTSALKQSIEESPETPMALIYVDLDNFKLINDLKGHSEGDKVLVDIANKLTTATRSTDVVARIGGDEFVVLVPGISPQDQAAWCDRLLMQLTSHLQSDSKSGPVATCSVGVAWYPKDGSSPEHLMAAADEAMYDAKRAGKNAWRGFQHQAQRDETKVQTILWADRIIQALREDGFDIFLQGVHEVDTKEVHHFEALIRMPNTEKPGSYYNPGEFIGYAEQSGKIVALDRWMIRHVIALLKEHPEMPPIAVNVSAVTFADTSIAKYIAEQLHCFGVLGKRLHLELTETAALSDIHAAQQTVAQLNALGCEVCLDDFGSGFASLTYLKSIDADYLKIDGMFIRGINENRDNQVLLRAIVDIAKTSNRLTVAEWIEDEQMLETIKSYHIDLAQGYHLSRPMLASKAIELYRADQVLKKAKRELLAQAKA